MGGAYIVRDSSWFHSLFSLKEREGGGGDDLCLRLPVTRDVQLLSDLDAATQVHLLQPQVLYDFFFLFTT